MYHSWNRLNTALYSDMQRCSWCRWDRMLIRCYCADCCWSVAKMPYRSSGIGYCCDDGCTRMRTMMMRTRMRAGIWIDCCRDDRSTCSCLSSANNRCCCCWCRRSRLCRYCWRCRCWTRCQRHWPLTMCRRDCHCPLLTLTVYAAKSHAY